MTRVLASMGALMVLLGGCSEPEDPVDTEMLEEVGERVAGRWVVTRADEPEDPCDTSGPPSILNGASHLSVNLATFAGTRFLSVVPCDELPSCQDAFDAVEPQPGWAFDDFIDNSFRGSSVTLGETDGFCTGTVGDLEATFQGLAALALVERRVEVDFLPDADGFCTTDAAEDAARGGGCESEFTLDAVFDQPLTAE